MPRLQNITTLYVSILMLRATSGFYADTIINKLHLRTAASGSSWIVVNESVNMTEFLWFKTVLSLKACNICTDEMQYTCFKPLNSSESS